MSKDYLGVVRKSENSDSVNNRYTAIYNNVKAYAMLYLH
jgi:hypothetical protein